MSAIEMIASLMTCIVMLFVFAVLSTPRNGYRSVKCKRPLVPPPKQND